MWQEKTLDDISTIFAGGDVDKTRLSKIKNSSYQIPIFTNGEKNKGLYGYTDTARVNEPSLTVSARGTIGYCAIRNEPFYPAIRLIVITPNLEMVNLSYLKYSIERMSIVHSGTSIPQLTVPMIKKYSIPLPSLKEQTQIVAILDEVFARLDQANANTEKNLANAQELFDSSVENFLTRNTSSWSKSTLADICSEKITDGTHQTPKYFDDGYIFLSSKNVTSKQIDWNNVKYIDESQHKIMHKRIAPQEGDILLAKNGTTGVAAIVDKNITFDIYVSLAWLRPSKEITSKFMWYFINSSIAKKQFNSRIKGSGVPNLHLKEIREVEIKFPRFINEQNRVSDRLDGLFCTNKDLKNQYESKLNYIGKLKSAILQKAFSGELTNKPDKVLNELGA